MATNHQELKNFRTLVPVLSGGGEWVTHSTVVESSV